MESQKEGVSISYYSNISDKTSKFILDKAMPQFYIGSKEPHKIPFDKFVEEKHLEIKKEESCYSICDSSKFGSYYRMKNHAAMNIPFNTNFLMGETLFSAFLKDSKGCIAITSLPNMAKVIMNTFDIDKDYKIGRSSEDLKIEDKTMSRNHAAIKFKFNEIALSDLGSSNGLWVSFAKFKIANGDTDIRIGLYTCMNIKILTDDTNKINSSDPYSFEFPTPAMKKSEDAMTEKITVPPSAKEKCLKFFASNGLDEYDINYLLKENNDNIYKAKHEFIKLHTMKYEISLVNNVKAIFSSDKVPFCKDIHILLAMRRGCYSLDRILNHIMDVDKSLKPYSETIYMLFYKYIINK